MPKILFKLSGSIAAYKACSLISRLVQDGHEVQTVATNNALEFVGKATLEGLTRRTVQTSTFQPGSYMQHIDLAKWADLTILCPASANTLNRMAAGIGDDLVTTLFLAHDFKRPYFVAPAMNTQMYLHPATQEALRKLKSWGVRVLEPQAGHLACGDIGEGRLLDPDVIYKELNSQFATSIKNVDKPLEILITSGGTKEPIDAVRSITNTSTGSTGKKIAEAFLSAGHRVTYLHAEGAAIPNGASRNFGFSDFHSLEESLRRELRLSRFAAVIHAAAVSDYSVSKVSSDEAELTTEKKLDAVDVLNIQLKRNAKLLPQLKEFAADPSLLVIGFKLTVDANREEQMAAVAKVSKNVDLVVHNDLRDVDSQRHRTTLFQNGEMVGEALTKEELGQELLKFIERKYDSLS